jgi:hypothetical protein
MDPSQTRASKGTDPKVKPQGQRDHA